MQAIYFPLDSTRQLFGWLHPAVGAARASAVVLCPTVGEEYMMAHQALRGLAEQLASHGFPVLRFDYDGTGDSSGDDRDPDRVGAWVRSVGAAIDTVKAQTGATQVTLVGFRFGATLAMAAAGRADVDGLQLVYPLANGKALAREIRAFNLLAGRGSDGDAEWAGFLFTAETMAALARLEPLPDDARLPRTLLVHRDDQPVGAGAKLAERLRTRCAALSEQTIAGFTDLTTAPHKSRFPTALFEALIADLDGRVPRLGAAPVGATTVRARCEIHPGVREKIVHFRGDLVGVRTVAGAEPGTAVIFLNTSANHRVGPSRMYVRFARRLAAAKIDSLRFDLGLLGDSGARARPAKPDEIYSLTKVEDVIAAIDLMGLLGYRRLLLVGLCSGAFTAFHTAVRMPPLAAGLVLINPQVFEWRPGDSLEVGHSRNYVAIDRYKKGLFDLERWRKLARGEIPLLPVARNLAERMSIVFEATKERLVAQILDRPTIADGFRALVLKHGIKLRLIYGKDDPGIDYLTLHAGSVMPELRRSPNFEVEIVDEADHVFTSIASQEHLGGRIVELAQRLG